MCGIAGIFNLNTSREIPIDTVKQMVSIIKHRGPDGSGLYKDNEVGLGHARLSIIDLPGGHQPMSNEDKSIWITFNGEIYPDSIGHKLIYKIPGIKSPIRPTITDEDIGRTYYSR